MKHIKKLSSVVVLLFVCVFAHAQWAGENKTLLKDPTQTQTVEIGLPGDPNLCYHWFGPFSSHILGNHDRDVVTVKPTNDEEIYYVRRYGDGVKNGSEEAMVIVRLVDSISIVSVTPTRCYNNGDTIELVHFDIVTSPPGYESKVKVSPIVAKHELGFGNTEWMQTETFTVEHKGHVSTKKTKVSVINPDLAITISVSPEFEDLEKKVVAAEKKLKQAKAICEFGIGGLANAVPGQWFRPPCDKWEWDRSYTLPTYTNYCCNGDKIHAFTLSGFTFSGSMGCEATFLIPSLGVPGVGGVYVVLGIAGGIDLGPLSISWRKECSEITLPVELFIELSGGARAQAMSKDLLSFSALLVGGLRKGLVWSIGEPVKWGKWKINLSLVCEAKAFSLLSKKITVPIGAWSL